MLGSKLKQAREARQLTLSEIEWATKIRSEFLQALEDEQFDALPSATHTRGFIRSYARYLDVDPDPLVAEFNQASGAGEIVSTRAAVRTRRKDFAVTPGMIVGTALIILIGIFGFYLKHQIDKYQASRAADVQPSPGRLSDLPTPTSVPTPLPSPTPSPTPGATGVQVTLRIDADTWLQVDVDGKTDPTTGKTYPAGTTLNFQGTKSVHVVSGKAAHTFVSVNGKDLGAMPPVAGGAGNKTYTRTT